ncbi:CocE/NonD family hydrolase C-terminal non-catalytic domain-containing protein, partial [Methylacidiphilum caldifontis]|uniref:CocE/NonD family hydrolase C-terminal non-catalytic domain-containing protein n=1 Tax=Methylacidiphilum caldifontis TaxID=2795386 RepID=UPI00106CF8DE
TANRFQAGHRIRLDVSSSNFPRFDVNPNTGEPIGRSNKAWVATNRIYMGQQCPSAITCYGYEE